MHVNCLKVQICVLGCMLRSHARNGNECQAPCHCHSAANFEIPGFKILVNPKLIWNSWNLACYHGAASTCRGNSFPIWGTFGDMLLTNRSFSQQAWWFRLGMSHLWGRNDIHCLLLLSKNLSCQHRTTGVLCQFLRFYGVCLDIFMH